MATTVPWASVVSALVGGALGLIGAVAGALLGIRWDRHKHARDIEVSDLTRKAAVAWARLHDQRRDVVALRRMADAGAAVAAVLEGRTGDEVCAELARLVSPPDPPLGDDYRDLMDEWRTLFLLCSQYRALPEARSQLTADLRASGRQVDDLAKAHAATAAAFASGLEGAYHAIWESLDLASVAAR